MKARPTIFISGVSHEFGAFRDAVESEIKKKGCYAENQPNFHTDHTTVEEMLRRRLHDDDAVIHLAGFRFGAEPNERPPDTPLDAPRRSYTQMEFDIARELQKPVYVFLSAAATVRQPAKPDEQAEDAAAVAFQLAHRAAIQNTNQLYYFFKDQAELCKLVAEIPIVHGAEFKADISRIVRYAPDELIGREAETELLNEAWAQALGTHGFQCAGLIQRRNESHCATRQACTLEAVRTQGRPHILTFVALGGEGKTSLVAKWAAELAAQDWPGCDAAFAWSFYSQGTRDQVAASSDLFLNEALTFFGDAAMANSPAGAFDKGRRLAQLVGERRALLILDGVEPLQYTPGPPLDGKLKDEGIAALLKGLAAQSRGLCVVTTRYSLPDLKAFWQTTAPQHTLLRLSQAAGVALLLKLGVRKASGTSAEFEQLVEDVKGHALTLNLLGTYLRDAHAGDLRRRDLIKLEEADAEEQGGHAFRVIEAYVRSFEDASQTAEAQAKGRRALALLKLLGLFDRPATADCLRALWEGKPITGLTELLFTTETKWFGLKQTHQPISEAQRNLSLKRLEDAKLLTVNRAEGSGKLLALDAHPLLREYFARRVRDEQPDAWRAAHRRLYEQLCATTSDQKDEPTLEDLQPLYQALAHGCQAGLQQEACEEVYRDRIVRLNEYYSLKKLGALGSDLGAVICFFETPWSRVSPALTEADQAWLLNEAAFRLRALGRLTESLEPMRAGMELEASKEHWENAAIGASNLSELELTLGEVAGAVGNTAQSVQYADRSGDAFQRYSKRTTHANALHQAGRRDEAAARFREAEQMQADDQPDYPLLYSMRGFRYCDLLLAEAERAAWEKSEVGSRKSELIAACRAVSKRAAQTLKIAERNNLSLLTIALDHLTMGCAALYTAILESSDFRLPTSDFSHIESAVSGLRRAGQQDELPRGLLTRAWLRHLTGARSCEQAGPDSAQSDLDEAWDIATRGGMRLFQADIHLYRARLFGAGGWGLGTGEQYPWVSPQHDLDEAEKLINQCGYGRRREELADAKAALRGSAVS
ncbi:MAG: DUF4062 domain-containing protein [Acidobacteria bacterium]|nr:DUF4062 domain-containing protein [Acidobacteriota bacterium]